MMSRIERYSAYLASDAFALVRADVLSRDSQACRRCGATSSLEVHHTTYANLGRPGEAETCLTLCRQCHQEEHAASMMAPIDSPGAQHLSVIPARERKGCRDCGSHAHTACGQKAPTDEDWWSVFNGLCRLNGHEDLVREL
jgi:hypothetical protein